MTPFRQIAIAALCAAWALPAPAGSGPYPITQDEIAAAVASDGVQISPREVSPLAEVFSSVAHPALKVKSMELAGDHLLIARLECADSTQCLPFMVALHVSGNDSAAAAPHAEPVLRPLQPATPLVHAGATAVLLLEGPHVHISLPVVCLENGFLGQIVRVANPDRSQYYTVQVTGERLLKGRL